MNMPKDSLGKYIHSEFKKRFGEGCFIEAQYLPHEAFVRIHVKEINAGMEEYVREMEAEFIELGRQVSVSLQMK